MIETKEMPAPDVSAATDTEQTLSVDEESIAEQEKEVNSESSSWDDDPVEVNQKTGLSLKTNTLDEVLDSYFEPKEPIIDHLLYPGTVILAGASKIGKSFLVAEIAYHVAMGMDLWDPEKYTTRQGEVLYLALEDDLQRIQTRFSRMFGEEGSDKLHFATASKTVDEGLMMQLVEYIAAYPKTKLIIIDTLQKIRGLSNETMSYSRDYDVITQLKNLSDKYGICILIVHHTRKQDADDCFEKISGTNGLMGSADAAIIMTRARGSVEAKIQITGRDQQEQIIKLEQDQKTLCWAYVELETTLWIEDKDPVVEKIKEFILKNESWNGTVTELKEQAGLKDIMPNSLSRKLNRNAGYLLHHYGIKYEVHRTGKKRLISINKIR